VRGVLFIVLAFACVAAMSALGKGAGGVSTAMIVFFQSAVSLGLLLPWALRKGGEPLRTSRTGLHLLRALAGLASQVLMFLAVKRMPLANAVLLANSAPLFIPLVTWAWLRQRSGVVVWLSVLLGFGGVLLILRPSRAMLTDPVALFALAAAACSALALVAVHQLSKTEPAVRLLFYYFLFSSLATAPFAVWQWGSPSARAWLLLGGVGLTMALSQLLIVLAYRHATPERIAPFNYTVVIFSGLIGWIGWHDQPTLLAALGAVLVTAGGALSMTLGGDAAKLHHGSTGDTRHFFQREVAK